MTKKLTELDIQVAEKVMGLTVVKADANYRGVELQKAVSDGLDLPHYSEKIDCAMKVFNRMREKGHRWLLNADDAGFHLRRVACVHQNDIAGEKEYTCDLPLGTAKIFDDLPRVICEAAIHQSEMALKE